MNLRTSSFLALAALISACTPSKGPLSEKIIGHCEYTGPNSKLPECNDYLGEWTFENAQKDCTNVKGTFEGGTICAPTESLGFCILSAKPEQNRTYIVSNNVAKCSGARTGCEVFGGGVWQPSVLCGGVSDELVVETGAWVKPTQVCFTPDSGTPGHSANGQVCVWQSIHGATEEGRSFRQDANCDQSRSGRPYYQKDKNPLYDSVDPRRSDPAYLAEEAWVKSQVQASSCVCCHGSAAPMGASIFDVDLPGSFANQFTDRGIAHGAGVVNSIPLGAFPRDMNNGFSKSDLVNPDDSIFLTTDRPRMKAFWQKELEHRGLTADNFIGVPDGFGPLSEQYYFKPTACVAGEGIAADGTITWGKGRARYVYVMATTSHAPTVFPNLDNPEGTLWRLDVPATGTPLVSGSVKYGVVPDGTTQRTPATGSAPALVSGQQYFLYVSADQLLPITRCLITAK